MPHNSFKPKTPTIDQLRSSLITEINNASIVINTDDPLPIISKKALASVQYWKGIQQPVSLNKNTDYIHRITVNFLRHHHSPYNRLIMSIQNKVGFYDAKAVLRERVYNEIAYKYPALSKECYSQYTQRSYVVG